MYTVEKNDDGTWWVLDPEGGIVATLAVKWEAVDFAAEMNGRK